MNVVRVDPLEVGDAEVIARTLAACARQVLSEAQMTLAVEVVISVGIHGTIADFVESALCVPELSQFAFAIGSGFLGEIKYEVMYAKKYGFASNQSVETRIRAGC